MNHDAMSLLLVFSVSLPFCIVDDDFLKEKKIQIKGNKWILLVGSVNNFIVYTTQLAMESFYEIQFEDLFLYVYHINTVNWKFRT